MKKTWLARVMLGVLIVGMCLAPVNVQAVNNTQDKLDEEQDNLDNLNEEKSELEEALDELDGKLAAISGVLDELEKSIETKKEEIDITWGQIEELSIKIEEVEEASAIQSRLAAAIIKYMYEQGNNMYIALLMSSDSFSDYINKNSYIEMMTEYQTQQLLKYQEIQKDLEDTQSEYERLLVKLEEEKSELDGYEEQVRLQQEKVETLIAETSNKLEKYNSQIAKAEQRIEKYEKQIQAEKENKTTLKKDIETEQKKTLEASETKWRDISDIETASSDRKLLANIIYCEAGNEPYEGMVAVGAVVMNRVMSSVFPNTIVGVIYQKRQFTPASSGRLAMALAKDSASEECYRAADAALAGVNNIGDCLYFRSPTNSISAKYRIGGHIFY